MSERALPGRSRRSGGKDGAAPAPGKRPRARGTGAGPAACACGGGCPRCALERDADRASRQVRSRAGPTEPAALASARPTPRAPGVGSGQPLDAAARRTLEPRFGVDLGHVRVHTDNAAASQAGAQRADAYTHGADIVFGRDKYAPRTAAGDALLAHELAHVVQQTAPAADGPVAQRTAAPAVARSVDQWLMGSVDLTTFTYTQLIGEIDELNQWLNRQMASTEETTRIEEVIGQLRAEVGRRDRSASAPAPSPRRERRRRGARAEAAPAEAPLPDRYPRVLIEMTSVHYADPAEMRAEYDLIMQWLARREISAAERAVLDAERENLAPQLHVDRERVARERHTERVRAALTPANPEDARAVVDLARTIVGISGEPGDPNIFYIYHAGERVAISRAQAEGLRENLWRELSNAGRGIEGRATSYYERYRTQLEINEDQWIVAGISGWLADVEDPGLELVQRYVHVRAQLGILRGHLSNGRLVEAAEMLPELERVGQEIRVMARAFYEGLIEGAEIAVARLEFTRNAAFAITGAIAAVVAAPVVAGFVGAGGLGLTGSLATGATVLGTGLTVGSGMAVVRGGSSATGTLIAGGSLEAVGEAALTEGATGFREGFIAGTGGAAGRSLGLALQGLSVGGQLVGRVIGEAAINGLTAGADVLTRPRPPAPERTRSQLIEEAALAGAVAAAASIPGAVLGGSNNPIVRQWVAPLTAGCTTYLSMRALGASHRDAFAQAAVAVASSAALSRAAHGSEVDAALEERGRAAGASVRETAESGARTVRSTAAAILVGTSEALPPLRSGFGGPSISLEADAVPPIGAGTTTVVRPDTEAARPPTVAPETETAPAPAPAPAPEAETAPATTTTAPGSETAPADEFNLGALEGPASVGPLRAMGRSAGTGRSRVFPSLDRVALSAAQRAAAIRLHGQRLGARLAAAWNSRRNAREVRDLNDIRNHVSAGRMDEARELARAAFDRHRDRFWNAVRGDPALRQIFTDAGMEFVGSSGAPVYRDPVSGEILDRMTLEHSTRLADDPTTALDANNLQTVLGDENSVNLEFIRANDLFQ